MKSNKLASTPKGVTPIELFFDLVFVFAFIQVTGLVLERSNAVGLLQGLIVLALLWWAWAGYAWLTNAVDTSSNSARTVLLASVAAMFVVAVTVPTAFGDSAVLFAVAYVAVRALHLVLYAVTGQRAILRLAPGFVVACGLLLAGSLFSGGVQAAFWATAIVADYGFPLLRGNKGLMVQPEHWAERHGLIVILALGETVIASGLGVVAAGEHLGASLVGGIVVTIAVIGGLWWVYFNRESERTHMALQRAKGLARTHLARDMYSYMHLALVGGVVMTAGSLETALHHPFERLEGIYPFMLGGGVALFLLGLAAIGWRRGDSLQTRYLAAAVLSLMIINVAHIVPAVFALGLAGLLLMVTAFAETRGLLERLR
jgi:low temperature requirement protein LtrA